MGDQHQSFRGKRRQSREQRIRLCRHLAPRDAYENRGRQQPAQIGISHATPFAPHPQVAEKWRTVRQRLGQSRLKVTCQLLPIDAALEDHHERRLVAVQFRVLFPGPQDVLSRIGAREQAETLPSRLDLDKQRLFALGHNGINSIGTHSACRNHRGQPGPYGILEVKTPTCPCPRPAASPRITATPIISPHLSLPAPRRRPICRPNCHLP